MKLTDEMIKEAGKEAMEMKLSAIENEEIPEHTFSEEFESDMTELIHNTKSRKWKVYRKCSTWTRVAAAIILVVISLGSATVLLEAAKSKLIDVDSMIVNKSEIKMKISSSEDSTGELGEITFTYLPDGMEETKRKEYEDSLERIVYFEDEDGWPMEFHQLEVASSGEYLMELSTYGMEESVVYVNEMDATLYTRDEWEYVDGEYTDTGRDYSILLWQEDSFFFELSGYVSADEIIQMAEGIEIN